jgi:hypothetical protein
MDDVVVHDMVMHDVVHDYMMHDVPAMAVMMNVMPRWRRRGDHRRRRHSHRRRCWRGRWRRRRLGCAGGEQRQRGDDE